MSLGKSNHVPRFLFARKVRPLKHHLRAVSLLIVTFPPQKVSRLGYKPPVYPKDRVRDRLMPPSGQTVLQAGLIRFIIPKRLARNKGFYSARLARDAISIPFRLAANTT